MSGKLTGLFPKLLSNSESQEFAGFFDGTCYQMCYIANSFCKVFHQEAKEFASIHTSSYSAPKMSSSSFASNYLARLVKVKTCQTFRQYTEKGVNSLQWQVTEEVKWISEVVSHNNDVIAKSHYNEATISEFKSLR